MDCTFPQLMTLMESMLSFHACYKYHPDPANEPTFFPNVRIMLGMLKKYVDRGDGTKQWRISKFHKLLHISRNATHFRSPRNYDAAKTEKGLREWVKRPSVSVARRGGDNYNNRVAVRLAELTALQKASTNLLYADAVQPDNDEFVATT